MAEVTSIRPADLTAIERNLGAIHDDLGVINSNVGAVDSNVKIVYNEIGNLAKDFHDFVVTQKMANRLQQAETRLVQIRQELEQKYGHYEIVRRTVTGILQADDLGIVKKETISTATEELMISTPNYWLAPCLVALAAWINDEPELAEKALREGIKRNDEKTSLFFALVCRRAERKEACLKWTQRYLDNQDEEKLDRKTIIILDAYASGLLGADSEGIISAQMSKWLKHLSEKPGFIEQQTEQWSDAINLKRKKIDTSSYTYLKKYSKTWPVLEDILEGAMLHEEILNYFTAIFEQEVSSDSIKAQLDEILNSLVTDFDDEELPLRKKEKFEKFVTDFDGDEKRARKSMAIEKTAFEKTKDFTQLLTDAAMKPESSNASISTQKFAISLTKDWITDAYNDIIAKNRMKIPYEIQINVDTFNDKTTDGNNEQEIIQRFNTLINSEKEAALAKVTLSAFEKFCLYGGTAIAAIGLIMFISNSSLLGLVAIIAGLGMIINHFSKKKSIEKIKEDINSQFAQKKESGTKIIRATIAEVVDFRAGFAEKDSESSKVLDFLDQLSPDQYVRKLSGTSRRINVTD
ncbi:MAG: hypothetical protein HFH68_03095 [Lachnospiraceae bacterium]|nr:hypothetical protein [Lachnospiraceae bacterium]